MADTVKVIEQCEVSPPPGSVPSTSIPLTFFDLPWLCCPPLKRIFFFNFPYSTQHFFQTLLPTLKNSLSLTLQHFFPFSSNLLFPPKPNPPHILYTQSNSLSFTVAESSADFTTFVSDSPKHVAADGKSFHHFMKFWASVCKSNGDLTNVESKGEIRDVPTDMVRHTFVLSHDHVEKLKKWVSIKCKSHGLELPHITTFVVTCSLIWFCKVKSEEIKADCRNRPEFSIPLEYFGNCLVCGNAEVKRSKLVGGNGILEAAIAIGSEVRHLQRGTFEGAETLMSNFTEFATLGKHMTIIAGFPSLKVYETDFGWGKPEKSEVVHVDNSGSISLSDCRDKEGRIEVGLALEKSQMKKFSTILEEHLAEISVLD
ncbi:hypothetical protein V8G54_019632 [Vigna mungo]|uniref:Uncharacterized protein n=1 Tax=Vigna mungo TaxID=3915 RepID=A0AAQ3RVX4_VIGMU